MLLESDDAAAERVTAVRKGIEAAFEAAVVHLGSEEARRAFREITKQGKRGRGGGWTFLGVNPADQDRALLERRQAARDAGESITALVRQLIRESGTNMLTESAIRQRIRRVVKQHEAVERELAKAEATRRRRFRDHPPTPSLLSED